MIDGRKVLAIVPARGGSKGLPGKNVAPCGGRPLIEWTVRAATEASLVDRTVVSTDDHAILAAARVAGAEAPFMRPAELATDVAPMSAVVEHALTTLADGSEVGVLLQATSPLRTSADIDGALRTFAASRAPSVVSVSEATKSPYWMFSLEPDRRMRPLFPDLSTAEQRQSLPSAYALNGAIYVFDVRWFRQTRRFVTDETVAFVMPAERSIDVDTALDLALADLLLMQRAKT